MFLKFFPFSVYDIVWVSIVMWFCNVTQHSSQLVVFDVVTSWTGSLATVHSIRSPKYVLAIVGLLTTDGCKIHPKIPERAHATI